jgi:Alpha galactosidase C-terminal beta sandwich domain/Alpha galactosidase A
MSRLTRGLTAVLLTLPMVAAPTVGSVLASAPAAQAEQNPPPGTDLKPVLGWSSWSFFRDTAGAAIDEAAARAMKESGLERLGYRYINQDDFWYQCPRNKGPNVDRYGRWVVRADKFPPGPGGENGIEAVASYVHSLGLKFGIYVTPGISEQAVAKNTPILGTHYKADQIATTTREVNYNCGGMRGINYDAPGAQAYVNSIVDEFARWGVDYIKLDAIHDSNVADIEAWSNAIRQSGHAMQLDITEGYFHPVLGPILDKYATQWEYSPDIENYGGKGLTSYANVSQRFTTLGLWEPKYGGRVFDAYNDFDSVEVGNCTNAVGSTNRFGSVSYPDGDGLTFAGRQTVLSLWALASSPFILGSNLTQLCPADMRLLRNRAVLSVEQDGIDASMIVNKSTEKVVAKTERNGDVAVGLFNTTTQPEVISTTTSAIGLPASRHYLRANLWTHGLAVTGSTIRASVPPHGVAFYRLTPIG